VGEHWLADQTSVAAIDEQAFNFLVKQQVDGK
jgi:hypothetical protein